MEEMAIALFNSIKTKYYITLVLELKKVFQDAL